MKTLLTHLSSKLMDFAGDLKVGKTGLCAKEASYNIILQ